ncbi:uncharacterized protein TRIADDRAFT_62391 [Trichoplax adhaerens]|uniref:EGF-like domain-containing protein n=1 Tax=Trichoplax adhaerens TaxID=10228 RepID=B3SDN4_TRIAD|nr:predicted protein [Trichoplax adhaerens]EDV19177.1 predicted protein [Trichoplax adhaerens]|eukprot:XP_002118355.1 predicted protein [Trichoplax adhaerens]
MCQGITSTTIVNENLCNQEGLDCDLRATCVRSILNDTIYYQCRCANGYYGDGIKCEDINECNSSQSVCTLQHQICINTDGDFRCRCDQETTGISYHKNCTECNANCSNTTVCVVTNDDRAICSLAPASLRLVTRCIPGKEGICPIPPSFDFRTITGLITGGVAFVVIVCLLSIFCYLKRKSAAKLEDDKQEHKQKS